MTDLPAVNGEPDRLPWEKVKGESRQAFSAFALYRDLGPGRSLMKAARETKAAREQVGSRTGTPEGIKTQLGEWSVQWSWQDRVDAYDAHVDARMREARESEMEDANRRQAQLGVLFQTLSARRIRGDADGGIAALDLNEADWSDVSRLAQTGVQIERVARGMPTALLAGKLLISPKDHAEVLDRLIHEAALPLIPPELHDRFWLVIDKIAAGR